MDWPNVMIVIGIGVPVIGCSLILAARFFNVSAIQRFSREAVTDFYMALVWGGMAIVQFSSAFLHRQIDGQFKFTLLAFVANMLVMIAIGLFAGRILLRWQMRH